MVAQLSRPKSTRLGMGKKAKKEKKEAPPPPTEEKVEEKVEKKEEKVEEVEVECKGSATRLHNVPAIHGATIDIVNWPCRSRLKPWKAKRDAHRIKSECAHT